MDGLEGTLREGGNNRTQIEGIRKKERKKEKKKEKKKRKKK